MNYSTQIRLAKKNFSLFSEITTLRSLFFTIRLLLKLHLIVKIAHFSDQSKFQKRSVFFFLLFCPLLSANILDHHPDIYHNDPAFKYQEFETVINFTPPIETVVVGGYIEIDSDFYFGPDQPKQKFLIHTARIFFTGDLYNLFNYLLMPRYDTIGGWNLAYAFLETASPNWGRIRIGQFKQPFSIEGLKSSAFRTFNEVALVVRNYCKTWDIGVMFFGEAWDNQLSYSLACMNGRKVDKVDIDAGNPVLIGRINVQLPVSPRFGRMYVGCAYSIGHVNSEITGDDDFTTQTDNLFWIWNDSASFPLVNNGLHQSWDIDFEWIAGSFHFASEFMYTQWGKIERGYQSASFSGYGGYAECSYVLTGETKGGDGLFTPFHNFNLCTHEWGAWEVAARYELFYASKKMIALGFAEGANYLHGPQVALNWYLNPRVKVKIDAQYLWFNRGLEIGHRFFSHEIDMVCRLQAIF